MKKLVIALSIVAVVGIGGSGGVGATGNGGPSGPHFTLNIHGVSNLSGNGFNGNNQNDIFVPLVGKCQINLTNSLTYSGTSTFQVLDPDCVSDNQASFELPPADPTNTGTTTYSVFARALGKPGGSSSTTTCFTDTTGTYCSIYSMVLVRGTGGSKFTNVSQDLLYVYYCNATTNKIVRAPLFSDPLASYYWQYDNNGLKLAQLRFYQGVQTTVASAGQSCTP